VELNFLPSPSKHYQDYSITKSSGDSVASGEDSGQWEIEGNRILAAQTCAIEEEEATADADTAVNYAIAELEDASGGGHE